MARPCNRAGRPAASPLGTRRAARAGARSLQPLDAMSAPKKPSHTIDSWLNLAELVAACSSGRWIFRGETVAIRDNQLVCEPLRPKAGRIGSQKGSARKAPYNVQDEERALDDFMRQARPHLGHTPSSPLEWLAIAQHHGMSTRLLDWTESLLVAAYFATSKANTAAGLIYGVENLRVLSKKDEKKPFAAKREGIYRPPHITPRIPAQRSVFTLHPNPPEPFKPFHLVEWIIPPATCAEIKSVLDACAINEGSLFPDLDGLSRYIGWRYKWGKL